MNCPFINLAEIKDPEFLRAAKAIWDGIATPVGGFCNEYNCLECPFFPEHLRENLLHIELRMLTEMKSKKHPAKISCMLAKPCVASNLRMWR